MRLPRPALIALALAGLTAGPAPAGFTTMVVFGDSLSDTGNLYAATGNAVPPPPYFAGRFSNGRVWVEYLADRLGLAAPAPALVGGTNYAAAGSQSGLGFTPLAYQGQSIGSVPNLRTVVGLYLAGNVPTGDELFTVLSGANDFLNGGTDPAAPAANVAAAVEALAAAGGRAFVVPTLPRLGLIPLAGALPPAGRDGLTQLTLAYNGLLDAELDRLRAALGITVYRPDLDGLFTRVRADPGAFGLRNVTDPALFGGDPTGDGYLFWDDQHPTTAGHRAIADVAFQTLAAPVPAPGTAAAFGLGLAGLAAARVRRRA